MRNAGGDSAVVRPCVAALARRQNDLHEALHGRSLVVLVAYPTEDALRLILTRSGMVSLVAEDEPFEADIEIRGAVEDIRSFLTRRTSLADAILGGVVVLRIPEGDAASYAELRALVADVVTSC